MASFTLEVCYKGMPEFRGMKKEPTFDEKIERAVRRQSDGSGYGMNGYRDLTFIFKKQSAALKAQGRVRTAAKVLHKRVRCAIYRDDE